MNDTNEAFDFGSPSDRGDFLEGDTHASDQPAAERALDNSEDAPAGATDTTETADTPVDNQPLLDDQDAQGATVVADPDAEEVDEGEDNEEAGSTESADAIDSGLNIPKHRFDKVNARRKEAEEKLRLLEERYQSDRDSELEYYRNQRETPVVPEPLPAYDFMGAEKAYMQALTNGDDEKALSIRSEIRSKEREAYLHEAEQRAQADISRARESMQVEAQYQRVSDQLVSRYSAFQQNHEDFNGALVDEVLDLSAAYEAKGMRAHEALQKAADIMVRAYNLQPVGQTRPAVTPPAEAPAKPSGTPRKTDVKRNLETQKAQPPELAATGAGNKDLAAVDLDSMSEEEFEALPAATLRRLRGD